LKTIASTLPEFIKKPLRQLRDRAEKKFYSSGKAKYCPVCNRFSRRFRRYGIVLRDDAQCYYCGALERHRFLWLFITRSTNLFDGRPKKMLHVAPETCFISQFQEQLGENYITADLADPSAMVQMDIMHIDCPDSSFDMIYCSHVFEHVQDDRQAMREFYRILKCDGWAILLVPIISAKTIEDISITDPQKRLKVFGHKDHVRRYGPDYIDRLREAGFNVEIFKVDDLVRSEDAHLMGLTHASGEIYFCTKPCMGG
jgi:SAM-dependent methyltransferase